MQAGVSHTLRFQILMRDGHRCRYCGASAPQSRIEVEHITPLKQGGSNEPGNLVASCRDCNRGKGTKLLTDSNLTGLTEIDLIEARLQRFVSIQQAGKEYAVALDEKAQELDDYWWSTLAGQPQFGFAEPTLAMFRYFLRELDADRLKELMAVNFDTHHNPKSIRGFYKLAWREKERRDDEEEGTGRAEQPTPSIEGYTKRDNHDIKGITGEEGADGG